MKQSRATRTAVTSSCGIQKGATAERIREASIRELEDFMRGEMEVFKRKRERDERETEKNKNEKRGSSRRRDWYESPSDFVDPASIAPATTQLIMGEITLEH